MRFFIALELPLSSIAQIEQLQREVKNIIPELHLTDPAKLHLTIAFLGDQADSLEDDLVKVIKQASQGISKFSVTPAYIDGFPALHSARVFWLGVKGDIDKLMILRERVKDNLYNLNLGADERRYVPHITVGKVDEFKLQPGQEEKLQKLMSQNFDSIEITSIKLFESIPEHGFHKHNTLAEIKLI